MTSDIVTSASTTLWHIGFGNAEPIRLEYIEIESFNINHTSGKKNKIPAWLELSGPLPYAERLLDIDWGHLLEIHHQRFGRIDEYLSDALYISIDVVGVEPMNIEAISSPYPPEEKSNAAVLIRGYCTIHRRLGDND